jgi:transcriptional regulator with XRE-family HTH domain
MTCPPVLVKRNLLLRFQGWPDIDSYTPHMARAELSKREIGQRLRALRRKRGLSQAEVAAVLHTGQANISHIERGARGLTIQQLVKFAKALRASTDDILLGQKTLGEPSSLRSGRLLRRLQRIEELDRADQRAVLKYLDALLARNGHRRSRG